MAPSVVQLLAERPGARAWRTALIATVALAGFWILDAAFDALLLGHGSFGDQILRPPGMEVWMRGLVAALLALLWLGHEDRARLRLLSSALAEAADGVQVCSLDGVVAYSNAAVKDIYGFSPEELVGRHVNTMNVDPDFATREILPALRQGGRWAGELLVKHRDGHGFPVWLAASLVLGRGRRPVATVGVIRDLTERKRQEEELRRYAERLEEATRLKDLFADILRHDLLGPASTLRLSVDLLLRTPADAATRRVLESARRSCAKLTEMIESAAKYAKVASLEGIDMRPLDLGEVLEEVVADFDLLVAERRASIAYQRNGAQPVKANPVLADVFANLLSNAVKYGPAEGRIDVAVADEGDRWVVSVADRGEGIRDADKDRVFHRFERVAREGVQGTGLGLAIARHIVDLHGGRIWVDDREGGGSVFKVALPKA